MSFDSFSAIRLRFLLSIPLLAGLIFQGPTATWAQAPDGGPESLPLVVVARVEMRASSATIWVPGTLVSRNDAFLAAEVAGRLVEVAEVGEELRRGDIVARLDQAALKLELRSEEAEVGRLEARLEYLIKQVERIRKLADEQITSRRALDELEAERAMAVHELEAARVSRDQTQHAIDRSTLRAPFSGVLAERKVAAGSFVTVGEDVARLVDTSRVEIQASAPLSSAPWVREKIPVAVRGGGERREGRVRAAVKVADPRSRNFEIRVTLDDAPWAVGSPLEVAVPNEESAAVKMPAVPRDALVLRRDATWIWVLADDDSVRRVEVEAGLGVGDLIYVGEADLAAGDRVVIRGGEGLESGQKVRVTSK